MTYCLAPKVMNFIEIDSASLIQLKQETGLSVQALAIRFKVSTSTIKRKLKPDQTDEQKEVSEFTARLAKLIAEVPDGYARRELNRAINKIRQHHSATTESKYQKVIESIRSGAREADEIASDCDFLIDDCRRLLDELIAAKRIIKQSRGGVLNRGRKTKYHYLLAR